LNQGQAGPPFRGRPEPRPEPIRPDRLSDRPRHGALQGRKGGLTLRFSRALWPPRPGAAHMAGDNPPSRLPATRRIYQRRPSLAPKPSNRHREENILIRIFFFFPLEPARGETHLLVHLAKCARLAAGITDPQARRDAPSSASEPPRPASSCSRSGRPSDLPVAWPRA
jgi:hypothetical protein